MLSAELFTPSAVNNLHPANPNPEVTLYFMLSLSLSGHCALPIPVSSAWDVLPLIFCLAKSY